MRNRGLGNLEKDVKKRNANIFPRKWSFSDFSHCQTRRIVGEIVLNENCTI